jgi:hypothetical protein
MTVKILWTFSYACLNISISYYSRKGIGIARIFSIRAVLVRIYCSVMLIWTEGEVVVKPPLSVAFAVIM